MDVKPTRILWPTDFSELSLCGGRYALALRDHFSAELHIIHVVAPVLTADFSVLLPVNVPVPTGDEEILEACRQSLARLVKDHFGGDESIVTSVFMGNPWSAICEYAEREHIDLLVITTHGRTGFEHVVIGSTAERVVQHAPCPVLTIKRAGQSFLCD